MTARTTLVFACIAAGVVQRAAAQSEQPHSRASTITVTLDVPEDELPSQVCVVHDAVSTDLVKKSLFDTQCVPARECERAQELLKPSLATATMCGSGLERCLPDRPAQQHTNVTCSSVRAQTVGRFARLLVLQFDVKVYGSMTAHLDRVGLIGNQITIEGKWDPARPTIAVVGGHYAQNDTTPVNAEGNGRLTLRAKCSVVTLKEPVVQRSTPASACGGIRVLELNGQTLCKDPPTGPEIDVLVPLNTASIVGRIPNCGPEDRPIEYSYQVLHTRDGLLSPLFNQVVFRWQVREEYWEKDRKCPQARPIGADCDCEDLRQGGSPQVCLYRCQVPRVGLPRTIQFEVGKQKDAWSEDLVANNELLRGYADRDRRQFGVVIPGWNDDVESDFCDRAGTQVYAVDLWTPDGHNYQLSLCGRRPQGYFVADTSSDRRNPRITIPGGVAGDSVRYQYSGYFDYWPGIATVNEGRVSLEPADEMVMRWSAGLLVAAGPSLSYRGDWAPTGQVQLAGRYEGTPFVELGVSARWSKKAFSSINASGRVDDVARESIVTYEIALEPAVLWSAGYAWQLGGALSGGWRHVVRNQDARLAGGMEWFLGLAPLARARFARHWWLEGSMRLSYPRSAAIFESNEPACKGELCGVVSNHKDYYLLLDFAIGIRTWL